MAHTEWRIKGREFVNCNCSYGCPCQFNAPPTHGDCQAVAAYAIEEGHHGEVRLDGLRAALFARWPRAIHQGGGEVQAVIDARADAAQREALRRIIHGHDTEPGATVWQVFSTTYAKVHEPLVKPIEFEVEVAARTARLVIPGVIEGKGEPILNPVTGAPHRARIDLPHGFEYTVAEIGSGTSRATGAFSIAFADSYGQFADIHLTQSGVVR